MIRVSPNSFQTLVTELACGLARYREGGERARRDGACAQIEALVKLSERVLEAGGVSAAQCGELFEPIRELHAAAWGLNERANPRLLRPLLVGSRRPVEISDVMWRGEAAAAYELWLNEHDGSGKDGDVLAGEVATKIGHGVTGASVKEYRRNARSGEYPRLAERYDEMLRLAEEHFPGEPGKAAEKLAESAGGQVR